MKQSPILENLLLTLPAKADQHSPESELHISMKQEARKEIISLFPPSDDQQAVDFKPFGELIFPYHKMGAIDSLNLFDLDELIIFSFYWKNRNSYKRTLDVGANLGLHSIMMAKCGFEVQCYEPDPTHFKILTENLARNNCTAVKPFNCAASIKSGEMEFTRVLGNTTGSHLSGAKANPYGELERFKVQVVNIRPLMAEAQLIKMDVEGHEKDILLATEEADWENTDAMVEIQDENNAKAVYEHFNKMKVNLFPQKINWTQARTLDDMPTSYREGTLFISCKDKMPW